MTLKVPKTFVFFFLLLFFFGPSSSETPELESVSVSQIGLSGSIYRVGHVIKHIIHAYTFQQQ